MTLQTRGWFHTMVALGAGCLLAALVFAGCNSSKPGAEHELDSSSAATGGESVPSWSVVAGEAIGPIRIGMRRDDVIQALGEPSVSFGFQRMITWQYEAQGLEVFLTSSAPSEASEDAVVSGVSVLADIPVTGAVVMGRTKAEIIESWGEPFVQTRGFALFPQRGVTLRFDESDRVQRVSVWPAYEPDLVPAPMEKAIAASSALSPPKPGGQGVSFRIDGEAFEVVDMHLHAGGVESQQPTGMRFLLDQLPESSLLYYPAITDRVLSLYDEHLGLREHTKAAGIARGVVLATYTHRTIGHTSNAWVRQQLLDPRNVTPDGRRWAWGMVSINYEGYTSPGQSEARLSALGSYFKEHPELFIGIKLAHAHQAVSFDDPAYLGVYDVAAEYGVPVLLHTGFSPFPHTSTEPEFYDPESLRAVIKAYDGTQSQGRVDFIFAHVGQGDARSIDNSLRLASEFDNVWLEISAIERPLLLDEHGHDVQDETPMGGYVLEQIKARGLVERTIFATDGPQYFGKLQSYLSTMVSTMKEQGYSSDDLRAVLAGNFYRCFGLSP